MTRILLWRLRSARTVMQLQGKSAGEIDSALPSLRQEIVASFHQVPDAERKALQAAESRWWGLHDSMNASTPEQRLAKLNQAAERAAANPSTANMAHALEEGASYATLMAQHREHTNKMLELLFEGAARRRRSRRASAKINGRAAGLTGWGKALFDGDLGPAALQLK